jgi:hypothetical protein
MREQSGLCALCGHRFPQPGQCSPDVDAGFAPTFDHVIPRVHGGEDALHNLRLVHRACNHMRGDAGGLERIPPIPRSLRVPAPPLRRVRISREGEAWCRNRDWKRAYPSLTTAWIAAFCSFSQTGRVHAPYRCGRSTRAWAVVRHRVSTNPWRFDPIVYWIGSVKRRSHGCGLWHLTSLPGHLLSSEKHLALPKPMGWEAYHRAVDGSWVPKDRECIRGNGLPKKQFATREDAERCARAMSVPEGRRGRRYHAYVCSNGHIHVGALKD